ncbi:MAG: hypothetical protein ACKOFC_03415, partial [Solirubrobacterales bacterium]
EASDQALLAAGREDQFSHLAWDDAELRSTVDELKREHDLRPVMVEVYRAAAERPGAHLLDVLSAGGQDRPSELSAVIAGVFLELGIARIDTEGRFVIRDGVRADLDRSSLRRRHAERARERLEWLSAQQSLAA